MKPGLLARGVGMALLASALPLSAQPKNGAEPSEHEGAAATAAMAKLFNVPPLTAEQSARLPQANALIARIMPPGTLDELMGSMYERMLGPMMAMAGAPDSAQIARELGIESDDFSLSESEAAQAAAILDPNWKARREREMKAQQGAMAKAMRAIEPPMRKGMAEAYAVAFTAAEMTDIAAFFATPSGASYARKSYALVSDPRIMAASFEAMPAMIEQMKSLEADVKAASADLPPKRRYQDLSAGERGALAKLTGLSPAQLKAGMERAAAAQSDDEPDVEA